MTKCGDFWLRVCSDISSVRDSQSIYILFQTLQDMWWIMGTQLIRNDRERGRGSTNELRSFYELQMESIVHCVGNNWRRWMGLLFSVFWGTQRTFKFLGKERFCSPFLGPCQTWNIMFSRRQTNPMGYRGCSRNWKVTDSDKWQLVQYSWGSNYRWNNVGLK